LALLVLQFDNPHVEPFDLLKGDQVDFTQEFDDLGLGWVLNGSWPSLVPERSLATPAAQTHLRQEVNYAFPEASVAVLVKGGNLESVPTPSGLQDNSRGTTSHWLTLRIGDEPAAI
jgi:hypothetical protein